MDPVIAAEARRLGLERALELFPNDVEAAWRRAAKQRRELEAPDDERCEPWPPMRCLHDTTSS